MSIQYIEDSGKKKFAVLPIADYERLVELAEDTEDSHAIEMAKGEESFPADFVEKLIYADHPLSVWREYRGITQKELEAASGVDQGYIAQIEKGKKTGSVETLKKLSVALNVDIDDLII
jgi:DNA-binding XRE family transcriptional regulator